MKHKFIRDEDMVDGMRVLGVTFYESREHEIRRVFLKAGIPMPEVIGYVVRDEEGGEDEAA